MRGGGCHGFCRGSLPLPRRGGPTLGPTREVETIKNQAFRKNKKRCDEEYQTYLEYQIGVPSGFPGEFRRSRCAFCENLGASVARESDSTHHGHAPVDRQDIRVCPACTAGVLRRQGRTQPRCCAPRKMSRGAFAVREALHLAASCEGRWPLSIGDGAAVDAQALCGVSSARCGACFDCCRSARRVCAARSRCLSLYNLGQNLLPRRLPLELHPAPNSEDGLRHFQQGDRPRSRPGLVGHAHRAYCGRRCLPRHHRPRVLGLLLQGLPWRKAPLLCQIACHLRGAHLRVHLHRRDCLRGHRRGSEPAPQGLPILPASDLFSLPSRPHSLPFSLPPSLTPSLPPFPLFFPVVAHKTHE